MRVHYLAHPVCVLVKFSLPPLFCHPAEVYLLLYFFYTALVKGIYIITNFCSTVKFWYSIRIRTALFYILPGRNLISSSI